MSPLSRRSVLLGRLLGEAPAERPEAPPLPDTGWRPTPAFSRLDALTAREPPRPGQKAFIRLDRCLAWTGSFCTTCAERCPVDGAITLQAGRPIVEVDRCTGCGGCGEVCPAPDGAIGWRTPRGGAR